MIVKLVMSMYKVNGQEKFSEYNLNEEYEKILCELVEVVGKKVRNISFLLSSSSPSH